MTSEVETERARLAQAEAALAGDRLVSVTERELKALRSEANRLRLELGGKTQIVAALLTKLGGEVAFTEQELVNLPMIPQIVVRHGQDMSKTIRLANLGKP